MDGQLDDLERLLHSWSDTEAGEKKSAIAKHIGALSPTLVLRTSSRGVRHAARRHPGRDYHPQIAICITLYHNVILVLRE